MKTIYTVRYAYDNGGMIGISHHWKKFADPKKATEFATENSEVKPATISETKGLFLYNSTPFGNIDWDDFESLGDSHNSRWESKGTFMIVKGDEEARKEVEARKASERKHSDSYYAQPWV